MWNDLWFRLRALFRRSSLERDLADELDFHIEQQTQKHLRSGHSADEAARLARLDFGAVERAREQCREASGVEAMDSTMKDIRYACRLFRKSPIFTVLAVLSLALGTGVNTAVFSVVHAVLLKPLPYAAPDRIISIGTTRVRSIQSDAASIPEFDFLKQHNAAFASVAGYRGGGGLRVITPAGERQFSLLRVTADFLRVLQVRTTMGRDFTSDEMRLRAPQVMIISDEAWKSAFAGSPDVVGKQVSMDDTAYTIVGVLPRDFWFSQDVDALVPLRPTGSLGDTGTNTMVIGRLGDSVNPQQAQAESDSIAQEFRRTTMDVNSDFQGYFLMTLHDRLVGDVRLNLELLFGATGLLVLIGCSNLASLLMTRLANRRSEFAVRLAIGGSTARILRQLFIENFLLAGLGSIAGVACAYGLLRGLMAIIPFELPATGPVAINVSVLGFTVAVSFLTTLLFTIVPFFSNTRVNCDEALRTGVRSLTGGRRHARNALVVAEVALSTLLLIGAGLLINSLYQLYQEDLGFNADGVVTVGAPVLPEQRVNSATFAAFTAEMLQAIRSTGASRVAAVNVLPLEGQSNIPTQRYGHTEQSIGGMEIRLVTPEYFEIMGIPLRQGRRFGESDSNASAPVAIVSDTVLRRWWPDGKALGDKLIIGRFNERDLGINDQPREVVGVVGDTKTRNLKDPARPTLYIPVTQAPPSLINDRLAWVFAPGSAGPSLQSVRGAIERLIPANRIGTFRTMPDLVRANIRNSTFNAWLFGIFAGVAVALAAIGIFGLLSYTVAQRRQEIGMRIALGATRSDVARLVIKQGLVLITVGLVLGVVAALFLTRYLATLLYRIKANDPLSYVAVIVILAAIGLIASYIPARRATRIDPMAALRW